MKKSTLFTKVTILVLVIFLTPYLSLSQHFTPPTGNNGAGQWQMFAGQVTLDGQNMVAGDEIGVYDGATCVGSFVLTQVCTEGNVVQNEFYAYEENGGSTVGYTGGNAYTFKLWDNSAGAENIAPATVTYITGGQYSDLVNFPAHNQYSWSLMKFEFSSGNGLTVEGIVEDASNTVIEGANIELYNGIATWNTTTDASGEYSFIGVPDFGGTANYIINVTGVADHEDYSSALFGITDNGISNNDDIYEHGLITLELLYGNFNGTIQDQYGSPILDANVKITDDNDGDAIVYNFTTLANGQYSYDSPVGDYSITITKPGYTTAIDENIAIATNETITENYILTAPPGFITGYAKFEDGDSEIGANGVLVTVDGTTLNTLTINEAGNPGYFNISGVPSGTRSITLEGGAFTTKTVFNVEVVSGATVDVGDIILTMSSYYNFTPGDPGFSVWTVYLSDVLDVGTYNLKAGDEIAIYDATADPDILVGAYQAKGDINGTASDIDCPVLVFSKLANGNTGYTDGNDIRIDVHIAGGTTTTVTNDNQTWAADDGGDEFDWDPTAGVAAAQGVFPDGDFKYSIVDLDFSAPNGNFTVNLEDEYGNPIAAADVVTLTLTGPGPDAITATGPTHVFSDVPSGTYTLAVSGELFQTKTITGIVIGYAQNLTKTYRLSAAATETQTISLHAGINIMSRRVGVTTDDMLDYFPTDFRTNLDVVSNENGNTLQKVVVVGWSPEDYAWDVSKGYKVLMNGDDDLYLTGVPKSYNTPIPIRNKNDHAGYNIVAYYPDYALNAETAFTTIKTLTLGYVRQWDGKMLRYLTALGEWDNQIGTVKPGQGYIVQWQGAADGSLVYPAETKSAESFVDNELQHFDFAGGNPFTNICTFYIQSDDLEIGDEVAAFDGDKMVGAVKIVTNNSITGNALNMFSGLQTDDDGYTPGNEITLVSWKANSDKEYRILYNILNEDQQEGDQYAYAGDGFPEGDYKYSLVELTLPLAVNENIAEFIDVYPNPSYGIVNINSPVKIDKISIVNIMGQTIKEVTPESYKTEINIEGFNPGVYFINIIIEGNRITKKITNQ
jgi:hypothetical protein